MIWQDGEQIDWEGKEEAVKSATWVAHRPTKSPIWGLRFPGY
jgi:hypothetical protein